MNGYITLGTALVPFGVFGVFWLFRTWLPSQLIRHLSPTERQALIAKFQPWNVVAVILFLIFTLLLAVLFTILLAPLITWYRTFLPVADLVIVNRTDWTDGVGLAFMGAIFVAGGCCELVFRAIYGAQYVDISREWRLAEECRTGCDSRKALMLVIPLGLLFGGGISLLFIDNYVAVDKSGVTINRGWTIGTEHYEFDDISRIVVATHLVAPSGSVVQRTRTVVAFRNGRTWCMEEQMLGPKYADEEQRLINMLCERSGQELQFARFFEDIPSE